MNSSVFHWSCRYFCLFSLLSHPSPPSLPPPLCIFSLFFSLWTAYCSILKVPACVLSCPLLPSMHRSDLELCRLRMSGHFWCQEREAGEDRQTLWCLFIYSLLCFPCVPAASCCHRFEKGSFFPPSPFYFFLFSQCGPETVSIRLKNKEEKHWTDCVSRCIVLMWPSLVLTDESSNCQAERALCVCVLCKMGMFVGQEMHKI